MGTIRIVSFVFLLLGSGMLTGAAWLYHQTSDFVASARHAQGTVVRLERRSSNDGNGSIYAPVVEYRMDTGQKITFTSSSSSNPPGFSTGQSVDVLFNHVTGDARINTFWQLWGAAAILGGLGSVFFCIGGGIMAFSRWRKDVEQHLKLSGRPLMADFQEVARNTALSVNGRNPFRILAQWQDPQTRKIHIFHSDNIWFNPEKFIDRKQLTVYVDGDNLKKYYVDISFLPEVAE